MRRKTRLTISIIAIILVAFFMGWGIWAAVQDIGIDGDVSFSAESLNVTITGKMYGHDKDHMTNDTAFELEGATWTDEAGDDTHNLDWSNLPLNFADKSTDIVIVVSIQNNNPTAPINVGVENKSITEGKNFEVTIDNAGTSTPNVIGVGETINYTITLKIVDKGLKVDGKLDVIFSLVNAM